MSSYMVCAMGKGKSILKCDRLENTCRVDVALKIFVIACFILLLWVGCVSASTLVVNQTSPACTSGDEYFTSVQAAVDRAKDGDEIVACPGIYVENINIIKSISLKSHSGSSDTIIEAKNVNKNIVSITANKVNISGFTIRNSEADGIYLDDADGCNLSENNIYSTRNGICLLLSNNNKISSNTANLNYEQGILLVSSNNTVIEDNNASDNLETGITLSESNNNTIRGNTANSQYFGIFLYSSNNNDVIENIASNNMRGGMHLFNSSNSTIKGNIANSNKLHYGIWLDSSNNNDIIENNASNNVLDGIILGNSSNNTIKGNTVNSNKNDGILLQYSSNNIIRGNTANSNKHDGITLFSSNNNDIIENNASNNIDCGIYLFVSGNNTIKGNTANSNYGWGIGLSLSDNNDIMENIASKNMGDGIGFSKSDGNIITNNIIYLSLQGGIYLTDSERNNISNNIINSNDGLYSVWLSSRSKNNNVVNNIINANKGRGLLIWSSEKNNVLNNSIDFNGEIGIVLFNSSSITISGNTISSNYLKGIGIDAHSYYNKIYHNNIINKEIDDDSSNNWWYNKSLKEGNYWSDYDGIDLDGNGVGDTKTPHKGYDPCPLMSRDGWLTMSVWPHYRDFGKVYQGTLINQTFTITNYGNSILNVSSIKSDPTITIFGIELPAEIPKGHSQSFNITLNTEKLEGFVLKNIEIISNDSKTPRKNITIFGFVEIPAHNIIIRGVDYQSRVIKGQINLFNVTINNTGEFREKNVSIEFKEGNRSLGNTIIKTIESKKTKSAIFKWDTSDVAPKTYDITIEVKLKDKQLSLASLQVPVKVDMPSAAQTLMVTNKERLAKFWGAERAEKLENELIKLSYHVSVAGVPVYVEENKTVASAYESWDLNLTCPQMANDVAKQIKRRQIADKLKEYTGVRYIIIVGDDRIIPYYRIPDNTDKPFGPESWYTEDDYKDKDGNFKLNTDSTVGSALRNNMFLTDNFYAADKPIEWKTGEVNIPELFIPSISVSRLVETPDEISAIIDAFYRKEYVRPDKIFVTAHDFMWDSAWYCCSTLEEKTKTRPETIISRNNTEVTPDYFQNVKGDLLNTSNDIVLIFQHAEHGLFSVPKRRESGGVLYTEITSRDICNSTADLNGAIVYSMSCHAGLNVPPSSSTNDFDLVQAFAQKGVVAYIAPTGFGIGSPRTRVAAHELLLSYFTRYLCEGMDAGTALMLAKQEYWATNYDFNYFDEQVLETTSLYGLPMVRINIPHSAKSYNESKMRIKSNVEEKPDTLVIRPTYTLISTRDGDYYITPGGELLSDPRKPILPKEIRIFHPTPTRVLRGAVMTSAKYRIDEPFKPLIEYYQKSDLPIELPTGEEREWFPARIFKINSISYPGRPAESRQYLIIITGQYKGPIGPGAKGKERMYDELSFDLYYTSGEVTDPPVIEDVSFTKITCNVTITVNAFDNESGIRRVLVTYTDITGMRGEWKSEDCKLEEGDLWTCSIPTEEEIEFFVQAVDNVGNVAIKDNDSKYFKK